MAFHYLVVLAAVAVAALTDILKFKVHNVVTLPLLLLGLAYHGFMGGWPGFVLSLVGAAVGFGLLLVFYLMGGIGAGDVKLLTALGAWLQLPWLVLWVFLAASLAAGIYALGLIAFNHSYRETWLNFRIIWYRLLAIGRALGGEDRMEDQAPLENPRARLIPFAAMIGLGVVTVLTWLAMNNQ
jgi:prepilin peptidase CpaA